MLFDGKVARNVVTLDEKYLYHFIFVEKIGGLDVVKDAW